MYGCQRDIVLLYNCSFSKQNIFGHPKLTPTGEKLKHSVLCNIYFYSPNKNNSADILNLFHSTDHCLIDVESLLR